MNLPYNREQTQILTQCNNQVEFKLLHNEQPKSKPPSYTKLLFISYSQGIP